MLKGAKGGHHASHLDPRLIRKGKDMYRIIEYLESFISGFHEVDMFFCTASVIPF